MKHLYCAQCGKELLFIRKALPKQGKIVDLVEPHNCETSKSDLDLKFGVQNIKLKPGSEELNKTFDKFKIVKKINDLIPVSSEIGDKRSSDHVRRELQESAAPVGITNFVKDSKETN